MSTPTKPYGHDITVAIRAGMLSTRSETFHFRGSEASCRRRAMMKRGAVRIEKVQALDERAYIAAYGAAHRM